MTAVEKQAISDCISRRGWEMAMQGWTNTEAIVQEDEKEMKIWSSLLALVADHAITRSHTHLVVQCDVLGDAILFF